MEELERQVVEVDLVESPQPTEDKTTLQSTKICDNCGGATAANGRSFARYRLPTALIHACCLRNTSKGLEIFLCFRKEEPFANKLEIPSKQIK